MLQLAAASPAPSASPTAPFAAAPNPVLPYIYSHTWLISIVVLVVFTLAGIVLQYMSRRKSFRIFSEHGAQIELASHAAFHRFIIPWMICLGMILSARFLPVSKEVRLDLNKALIVIILFTSGLAISDVFAVFVQEKIWGMPISLPSTTLTVNLIRVTVFIVIVLTILDVLGISISPILTALGVGSLAVALSLQPTLSNFFAGLFILKSGTIQIGDYIRLNSGEEGNVLDVTWRTINVKNPNGNMIYIPASLAFANSITNYAARTGNLAISIDIGVDRASDLDKVERLMAETAKEIAAKYKVSTPGPTISFKGFLNGGFTFNAGLTAADASLKDPMTNDFLKAIYKRFQAESIQPPLIVSGSK